MPFVVAISYESANLFKKTLNNRADCVRNEALRNATNKRWSSLICVMALCDVIEIPVESHYPPGTENEFDEALLSSKFQPRTKLSKDKQVVHLLWSRSGNLDNESDVPYNPNHFVPIFKRRVDNFKVRDRTVCTKNTAHNVDPQISASTTTTQNVSHVSTTNKSLAQSKLMFAKAYTDSKDSSSSKNAKQEQNTTDDQLQATKINQTNGDDSTSRGDLIYDVGSFYTTVDGLSDNQKYDIVKNVWKPPPNFAFPTKVISGKNRKFNYSWLDRFPWLVYSRCLDGAFCLACVLFGSRGVLNGSKLDRLMQSPLVNWSNASCRMKDHEQKSEVHKVSMLRLQEFRKRMENKSVSVTRMIDTALKNRVEKNRAKLVPIVKTVLFCGKQNIPLRGHRDDAKYYDKPDTGNFQALLDFRVDSGDEVLAEHFRTASRNASYRSKTIQNELVSCCGETIIKAIVDEIKESKFYSISADEVQDCGNKEQMPLVIRYVSNEKMIQEKFIKFILCDTGLTGSALSAKIKESIRGIGLDIQNCRGQCYDGAGNMAGKCSGAAARISEENKLAIYTHCASHKLNLCVAASCSLQSVKNMMDHVRIISDFFNNSPKRQQLLESMIKEHSPQEAHQKLINVCRTRWIERIDGMNRLVEMFTPVAESLFTIRDNADRGWDSCASAAYGLASVCCDFSFICTLVIVKHCLAYTRPATVKLQSTYIDILCAYKEIDLLVMSIQKVRNSVDLYHSQWYQEACSIAQKVEAPVKKPRTASRQQHRSNTPASDPETYFKVNVTIPFLDHLLEELDRRFSEIHCSAVHGLSIIPSLMKDRASNGSIIGTKRKHDGQPALASTIENSGHNEQPSSLDVQQHEQLTSNSSTKPSDNNQLPASSVSNVQQKSKSERFLSVAGVMQEDQNKQSPLVCHSKQKSDKEHPFSISSVNQGGHDHKLSSATSATCVSHNQTIEIQRLDQQWKEDFKKFCSVYSCDFPNINNISSEVDMWETYWFDYDHQKLPDTIEKTLSKVDPITFPNIYTALKILAVLPVTSCSCERSASMLRRLKTYMRSTMSQDRLNGLALIYSHRNMDLDTCEVVDLFARKQPRRMELINILESDNIDKQI